MKYSKNVAWRTK